MKFKLRRLFRLILSGELKFYAGQYGEDIVLRKIFKSVPALGFYVDVGAHHPFTKSNTAYLWSRGWNGVNVDASIHTIKSFERARPADMNVCAAVVPTKSQPLNKKVIFYFNKNKDNTATCDPDIAKARQLNRTAEVSCTSLKQIIQNASERFGQRFDLLNVDIEGLDEGVIEDMAEWTCHPRILMIEIYAEDLISLIRKPSVDLIIANKYKLIQRMGHTAIFERCELI